MRKLALVSAAFLAACSDPTPDVVIETELGDIVIDVDTENAPISSADFLRYVDQGLYDGQGFYRVVDANADPRDMGMSLVQGGRLNLLPIGDMVAHEPTTETGLSNTAGSVALARDQPGTGSAAFFFINLGDNSFLDAGEGGRNPDGAGYAVFGTLKKGEDILKTIQARPIARDADGIFPDGQKLAEPVYILRAYRK